MTKIDRSGWKFQPYEDDGFYVLQTWRLYIHQEEGSDEPLIVQDHRGLAAAQAAAAPAMLKLLEMWRNQVTAIRRKKKR